MQANITATALNIRAIPDISGRVLAVLPQDTIVDVVGESGNWLEIRHRQNYGFISRFYADRIAVDTNVRGVVNVALLNVRQNPSLTSSVIGTLTYGTHLPLLSRSGDWYEIAFNNHSGFIAASFIEAYMPSNFFSASVVADALNVRVTASRHDAIIGTLKHGAIIDVIHVFQRWAEIRFNAHAAYVSADYIETVESSVDTLIPTPFDDDELPDVPSLANIVTEETSLAAKDKLPVSGNDIQRKVASTWNRFGALLQRLSDEKKIDVACAVAVLCVESSGRGFEQSNNNRMVIRFENHKFWKYWGRLHPETFHAHFTYNAERRWTGHKWRETNRDTWQKIHGNQMREWQVFEFARTLDPRSAMLSISMGAPQIMGFHFERIGYSGVEEMFHAFTQDIGVQISALFDFFSEKMIADLRSRDFEDFAAAYNGKAQRQRYGSWIKKCYESFKQLI